MHQHTPTIATTQNIQVQAKLEDQNNAKMPTPNKKQNELDFYSAT